MKTKLNYALATLFVGFMLQTPLTLKAQLSGNYLGEYQYGNLPNLEPKDLSSLYNQINLGYRYKNISLKTKIESFLPSTNPEKAYRNMSQFSVNYSYQGLSIQAGNIYETIGRGLLMRNYELPSSIWESRGYRIRYGFYKDLQGLAASYSTNNFKIKLLRGRVRAVDLPPTLDISEKRPDLIEGGEISYTLLSQNIGFAIMRQTNGGVSQNFLTSYIDGFYKSLSYYTEVAFGENEAHAIYSGINFYMGSFGASIEYKNYKDFLIGAGINDPPTLVKEHNSRLLNRSTHVPILSTENGFQIELNYQLSDGANITLNHATAKNDITPELTFTFREYYIEYQSDPLSDLSAKIFFDYAVDPFKFEDQRYTGGIVGELLRDRITFQAEIEAQIIKRDFDENITKNFYGSLMIQNGSKFSAAFQLELSDDPYLDGFEDKFQLYPGLLLSYQPVNSTKISLFGGKRRGGPACNSGVCYDVLDFEGIELRLSTTF